MNPTVSTRIASLPPEAGFSGGRIERGEELVRHEDVGPVRRLKRSIYPRWCTRPARPPEADFPRRW